MPEIDLSKYEPLRAKTALMHREAQISAVPVDGKPSERKYEFVFSSEAPVENRWIWVNDQVGWGYGTEILLHGQDNVDMSWIASGNAPFLSNHEADEYLADIVGASLENRKLKVLDLDWSVALEAQNVKNDIDGGRRKNVSVGYIIQEVVEVRPWNPSQGILGIYHITRWKPMECSSVTIPAVETVGFGRSGEAESAPNGAVYETVFYRMKNQSQSENAGATMLPENNEQHRGGSAPEPVSMTVEHRESDSARIHAIADLNRDKFPGGLEIGARAIAEGISAEEFFKERYAPAMKAESERQATVKIGLSDKEKKQFSMLRLLRHLSDDKSADAGYELEVCNAYASARGTGPARGGVLVPYEAIPIQSRAAIVSSTTGSGAVEEIHSGEVIDFLREQGVVTRAGARMLAGLVGKFDMARIGVGTTSYWVGELTEGNTDISTSSMDIDLLQFTAKTVGVNQGVTRRMMHQTSLDVEAIVRSDIFASLADAIDSAALAGYGASNQPAGVMYTSGVNTEVMATEATPLWSDIVNMETAIAEDKALRGALAYVCHPTCIGNMKQTLKASGVAGYITENNQINGYNYFSTCNAVKSSAKSVIFGNWNELMIGMWGGIEILADPYSYSRKGIVSITAFQDVDIQLRNPVSFCYTVVA